MCRLLHYINEPLNFLHNLFTKLISHQKSTYKSTKYEPIRIQILHTNENQTTFTARAFDASESFPRFRPKKTTTSPNPQQSWTPRRRKTAQQHRKTTAKTWSWSRSRRPSSTTPRTTLAGNVTTKTVAGPFHGQGRVPIGGQSGRGPVQRHLLCFCCSVW